MVKRLCVFCRPATLLPFLLLQFLSYGGATPFSGILDFSTSNQSIWGPGQAVVRSGTQFLGFEWNKTLGVGSIRCKFGACFGARLEGSTNGRVGLNLGYLVTTGDVAANLGYPARLTVDSYPRAGQPYQIHYAVGTPNASFAARTPDLQAFMDLVFRMNASASARVCAFGCLQAGGTLVNLNRTTEILGLNRNSDSQLRILGNNYGGNVDLNLRYGQFRADFTPSFQVNAAGTGSIIRGAGSAELAFAGLNVTNIVGDFFGFPFFSGDLGPLNYTLLSVVLGAGLDLAGNFGLQPGSGPPVMIGWGSSPSTLEEFALVAPGGTATFHFPRNTDNVHFFATALPPEVYFLSHLGFDLVPQAVIEALRLNAGSLQLGPLFSDRIRLGEIPLFSFNNTFKLAGFGSKQFEFDVQTPEPSSMVLVGLGLAALGTWRRRRRVVPR